MRVTFLLKRCQGWGGGGGVLSVCAISFILRGIFSVCLEGRELSLRHLWQGRGTCVGVCVCVQLCVVDATVNACMASWSKHVLAWAVSVSVMMADWWFHCLFKTRWVETAKPPWWPTSVRPATTMTRHSQLSGNLIFFWMLWTVYSSIECPVSSHWLWGLTLSVYTGLFECFHKTDMDCRIFNADMWSLCMQRTSVYRLIHYSKNCFVDSVHNLTQEKFWGWVEEFICKVWLYQDAASL